jgi:hypothetical protein
MRLHLQQISSEISPFGCGDLAVSGRIHPGHSEGPRPPAVYRLFAARMVPIHGVRIR